MSDGWLMEAVEDAGWDCPEKGCVKSFGHELDPEDAEHGVEPWEMAVHLLNPTIQRRPVDQPGTDTAATGADQ